ncbi:P-loop containing nucleoside triphosphate hydrolase protein [Suillus subluteus]|nr:P-loop containing nucleoside triphosphate hydrolase protein [Suillus subluteus]
MGSNGTFLLIVTSAAKEREKAEKAAQKKVAKTPSTSGYTTPVSQAMSPVNTPSRAPKKAGMGAKKSGATTPRDTGGLDARLFDMAALNLLPKKEEPIDESPPKIALERGKLLQEVRKVLEGKGGDKKAVSLVVIGHVDAGKSTLMGRLLYELGRVDEKTRVANERGSSKAGKSSFSWAWELDGTVEERERSAFLCYFTCTYRLIGRGITMDIALQSLSTPQRQVTILDAPGHKDFIPNMISGAAQADCALLVVDAITGEFEAGFDRGGQTREHLLLVRSLGVSQVIVAVNKLDQVNWDPSRFEEICGLLRAFLVQSGFPPSKTSFVPVSAMFGVNLVNCTDADASALSKWYKGPTLVDLLDKLEPPTREIASPFRLPISNVFKGQNSGTGVTGRICGGVVQVGERLRVLPGDESAIVRLIDVEEQSVPWAAAGTNATLYLTSIDPIHLSIGSVLCPPSDIVPLATVFIARIIVFDIQLPITTGASIELFHHSRDVPATISKLIATLDRASGVVTKKNPRVLTKGTSAEVEISLRAGTLSGPALSARPIPLEPFSVNKDMGRILVRRGGETISAGIVVDITS